MIKGVNKNVIEISDTGNACFERAILFVRPESVKHDSDLVRRNAADYLSGIKMRPWLYPKGKLFFHMIGWLLSAAVGAAATALFFLM